MTRNSHHEFTNSAKMWLFFSSLILKQTNLHTVTMHINTCSFPIRAGWTFLWDPFDGVTSFPNSSLYFMSFQTHMRCFCVHQSDTEWQLVVRRFAWEWLERFLRLCVVRLCGPQLTAQEREERVHTARVYFIKSQVQAFRIHGMSRKPLCSLSLEDKYTVPMWLWHGLSAHHCEPCSLKGPAGHQDWGVLGLVSWNVVWPALKWLVLTW